MRIVIDMQGAQTESRYRGIGRYTLSFVRALVRNRGEHEIYLALNGFFPETVEPIRMAFADLLPQENIRVWYAPGPVKEVDSGNDVRREIAEDMREAFLSSFQPDIIHISSLFEGYDHDAVTSIGCADKSTPVSVSLYDLIPLINEQDYLKPNPKYAQYYKRKLEHLKRASCFLAISQSSLREGVQHLSLDEGSMVNISTAIEPDFRLADVDEGAEALIRRKFGLTHSFILFTGGADERKNLSRLISAYASLPQSLRNRYQLVLAGRMDAGAVSQLKQHSVAEGLNDGDLCFTGYISDKELKHLYSLCDLFVFPSWHEGFGLPALEAMACGAPVIAANTSSLPEVIGLENALFDPFDVNAIANKLAEVLESKSFREMLREHGLNRAQLFSWDLCARKAIEAWENIVDRPVQRSTANSTLTGKLSEVIGRNHSIVDDAFLAELAESLAYNQRAGIERQLLVDVSELCRHDAATGVQRVVRSYIQGLLQSPPKGFRVEPVYASVNEGYRYARSFVQKFLGVGEELPSDEPVQWQRGDIFFGLDLQHHVQLAHASFFQRLRVDGVSVKFLVYDLLPIQLPDCFEDANAKQLHEDWIAMVAASDGAICISKSTSDALEGWLESRRYEKFQNTWVHIGADVDGSRPSSGLPKNSGDVLAAICSRPSFLCVSTIEPRKCQEEILDAIESLWREKVDVNLVLVGRKGWNVDALVKKILDHPENGHRLFWLQGISDAYLEKVYLASTCLVAASINEGFGLPIVEAARFNIPVIARDIPVFREIAGDSAFYFGSKDRRDLSTALKNWIALYDEGLHPKSDQLSFSTWAESTEKLKLALIDEVCPSKQILVDISTLVESDAKTGIQRVVRSILQEWLLNPPPGYSVQPVYATVNHSYRYARKFVREFLGANEGISQDEAIEYAPGDIFLALDLNHHVPRVHHGQFRAMKLTGVQVFFVVYDLLPIQFPHFWEPEHSVDAVVTEWLNVVSDSSGVMCISKAVAEDFAAWQQKNAVEVPKPFRIDWFHLGADMDSSIPTKGLPSNASVTLATIGSRTSFLMVGTLEPRKGHAQVLAAFEHLWRSGEDVSLVIVGKKGWLIDDLVDQIRSHPESGKRLFWLEAISDEYLEKVYDASACLIAASYGEGFGLPLIEAGQRNLPIIARDISVFREVAGSSAYYFQGMDSESLARDIQEWLKQYKSQTHPVTEEMQWLTWEQSARHLLEKLQTSELADCSSD